MNSEDVASEHNGYRNSVQVLYSVIDPQTVAKSEQRNYESHGMTKVVQSKDRFSPERKMSEMDKLYKKHNTFANTIEHRLYILIFPPMAVDHGNIRNGYFSCSIYAELSPNQVIRKPPRPWTFSLKYGPSIKAENGYLLSLGRTSINWLELFTDYSLTEGVSTEVDAALEQLFKYSVQLRYASYYFDFLQRLLPVSSILELVGRGSSTNMMRVIDKDYRAELIYKRYK